MRNITEEIIECIKVNRISTTEIADCLGKTGVMSGVSTLNRGNFKVGKVKWVYGFKDSNYSIHEQIQEVEKGSVVIVDAFDVNDRALFGELVSKYLILYCQAEAVIANGFIRDANNIIKQNYPIWCKGVTPVGCFNKKVEMDENLKEIILKKQQQYDGTIAVCDDTGVVIIPKKEQNEMFIQKLNDIEEQEDTWFDCIDRKKMNTFETVCKKHLLYKQGEK